MASKLERFSPQARRVLQLAQEEAKRRSHNYIGTEHLLLGLVREEEGAAGRVLRKLGAEANRVAELVEQLSGAGRIAQGQQIDLTPRTKQVIEFAVEEVRKLKHDSIGTEHLLLGLLRHPGGAAIDILHQLGLSAESIRDEVLRALLLADHAVSTDAVRSPDQREKPAPSLANIFLEKDWGVAAELLHKQEMVEAVIAGFNEGGLIVKFGQLRGFVPASQLSQTHQRILNDEVVSSNQQLQRLVSQIILIKVIEIDRERSWLILSERSSSL